MGKQKLDKLDDKKDNFVKGLDIIKDKIDSEDKIKLWYKKLVKHDTENIIIKPSGKQQLDENNKLTDAYKIKIDRLHEENLLHMEQGKNKDNVIKQLEKNAKKGLDSDKLIND
jgi:S-adenosylmethionine:tRNA-ribosyltransferase-isomerase (queuine synthetase)